MKPTVQCECPSSKTKAGGLIVITIETCCKRTCDGGKHKESKEDSAIEDVAHSDDVDDREESHMTVKKDESSIKEESDIAGENESDRSIRGESDRSIRGDSDTGVKDDESAVREGSSVGTHNGSEVGSIASEESGGLKKYNSSIRSVRENPSELEKGIPEEPEPHHVVEEQRHTLFTLPIVTERYHGPGCAMEISVLEKHENNCIYKKADNEGRNNDDDRTGSYDCIGRLVFRTCNTHDTQHTPSMTVLAPVPGERNPNSKIKFESQKGLEAHNAHHQPSHVSHTATHKEASHYKSTTKMVPSGTHAVPNKSSSQQSYTGSSKAHSQSHSQHFEKSAPNLSKSISKQSEGQRSPHGSIRSQTGHESIHSERTSKSIRSGVMSREGSHPSRASSRQVSEDEQVRSRVDQVMTATTTTYPQIESLNKKQYSGDMTATTTYPQIDSLNKKHYSGDDCKLHLPKTPVFISNQHLERISSSKKRFPIYADEAIQTTSAVPEGFKPLNQKSSQETISSLSGILEKTDEKHDEKQDEKRKSSIFGSMFRRSLSGKSRISRT